MPDEKNPGAPADQDRLKKLDQLAEGGMSLVFKAEDLRLKMMTAAPSAAPAAEAKAAPATAAPPVAGDTLREVMGRGAMRFGEMLPLASGLAENVARAVEPGGTWDITPERIIVALDASVHLSPEAATPRHGPDVLPYMSPERAAGRATDQRSVVFSLGAVVFEMAAGHAPFSGRSGVDTLQAILRDAAPLDELSDGPAEFRRILTKALEKDPNDRYQTVRDMATDLRRLRRDVESGAVALPSGGMLSGLRKLFGKK